MKQPWPADWQPTAKLNALKARAEILRQVRQFFQSRGVLEVQTPQLAQHTVTDAELHSFSVDHSPRYYLQTSPEYAMKRLLAAYGHDIFQISKAFRNDEQGQYHNPEFSMLEWYRVGFDHQQLMDEMDELLQQILFCSKAQRHTYAELCQQWLSIDCHQCGRDELLNSLRQQKIDVHNVSELSDKHCLQLLFSQAIEPNLGQDSPAFVYDFPANQAALARLSSDQHPVAHRFEVYFKGVELANGFYELTNRQEQQERFLQDLHGRGDTDLSMDPYFLAALEHGLPDCAGVALGLDRLIMLATGAREISEVIAFPWSQA